MSRTSFGVFLRGIRLTLLSVLALCTPMFANAYEDDVLSRIGASASKGAAPGYVQDKVCGTCHQAQFASYQDVGMAQSFRSAANATRIESFGETFFHEPSQRYYQIDHSGADLTFRRYQKDANGEPINSVDMPIAWVMGSGNRARSYIYQSAWGELFLLPLSWYSQDKQWAMSPGFEAANHPGLHRQVTRECMFCHNAFPEVEPGSDKQFAPELFPAELPEGTGCQRCHGPGAQHISNVLEAKDLTAIHGAIVNPAKLDPEQRDSVCFQCHMLPSASVVGTRVINRDFYSFRPGESLTDYIVHVDIEERGLDQRDRFEINHHGYRLSQSNCYRESQGELGCISCHDPHKKPTSSDFRSQVDGVCSGCHQQPESLHSATTAFAEEPCANCHMPTRRSQDVVNVTMTDHRIAKGPFDKAALIAPIQSETRPIASIQVLDVASPPQGHHGEIYRMLATLRSNRSIEAAEQVLRELVAKQFKTEPTVQIALTNAQFGLAQYATAEATARAAIKQEPKHPAALKALGAALLAQKKLDEAARVFQQSLDVQRDPEVHFNLAAVHLTKQDLPRAETQLDAALELRPTMTRALKFKALVLSAQGKDDDARKTLERTIALQPLDLAAYKDFISLLRRTGDDAEADRYAELAGRINRSLRR